MAVQQDLQDRFALSNFPEAIRNTATLLNNARLQNHQVPALTSRKEFQNLDRHTAYSISAAVCGLRLDAGSVPVGRKIGFTNRNIWKEYSVDVPTWSYMYNDTVQEVWSDTVVDLRAFSKLEPRIEPEIIFGLVKPPTSRMDDQELLSCIGWISHGFEIVISLFPDWKFKAADTTAASALHARLLLGPKRQLDDTLRTTKLLNQLTNFEVDLCRNGNVEDVGKGSNVLGGPILALRHLIEILEAQDQFPILAAGEMITTGTLTRALPIETGDQWHTNLKGIHLPGIDVRFVV